MLHITHFETDIPNYICLFSNGENEIISNRKDLMKQTPTAKIQLIRVIPVNYYLHDSA